MKRLIVIAGPTASGKTGLSVELAKAMSGEVISADSMQVYRRMDIGTAKIDPREMQGIPHHLIDTHDPDEVFNIQVFQQKAKEAIGDIYQRGRQPILAGGTGFYIQSVVYDINFEEGQTDDTYRKLLWDMAKDSGNGSVHELLKQIDPISYEKIHPNNVKRVIRALEYFKITGIPISKHNEQEKIRSTPYELFYYVLNMNRELLYRRIDDRVEYMIEKGLVREVEGLLEMGYHKDLVSMQGLGYKEIIGYLEGRYSLDEAIYILKRDTRHFAKRQLTWFKGERDVRWLMVDEYNFDVKKILNKIIKDIEEKDYLY